MDVMLVPGLWLDASSWDGVTPVLEAAGHRAHPMMMPGVGVPAPVSSDVHLQDRVDAVVTEIDGLTGATPDDATGSPACVLVGHSGGRKFGRILA